jgi:transposase
MSNVLSKEKKQQVIALGKLGWSLRRIERETGVRRETAGVYLQAAGVAVRLPGGWGRWSPAKPAIQVTTDSESAKPAIPANPINPNPETLSCKEKPEPAKPAIQVTTDPGAPSVTSPGPAAPAKLSASTCEPFRELIEQGLARGRNAVAIWQDLVSDHGFTGRYQTVKRFVRKLRGTQVPEASGIILTAAGEEAQVDYGSGPMVRDPRSGKYRRTRLFVLTLAYSRKSVRLLTWRSSARIWAELHEKAFRRLGGCPRIVVLDNLKEGVLVPDLYDPTVNPLFRDVLAHYGVVALPCRIQDPDRKGKVESGIGHTQKTPLKGMRFESLEEAQAYLDRWEQR